MARPTDKQSEKSLDRPTLGLAGDFLLLGCSILISLLLVELLIRHYYPLGETIYTLDRRYLHRHLPNSRQLFRLSRANGGAKVIAAVNGEGRRGDRVSPTSPHILVYGDSFIFGGTSPLQATFVWQLMKNLNGTLSPPPQVINCGVSGYGPDQESLVMEDEIDRLKPRLVIAAIYVGNDFGDLMRDKIYKLDARGQLVDNHYTLDPALVNLFKYTQAEASPLYTLRLLRQVWTRLAPAEASLPTCLPRDYFAEWLGECRREYEEYVNQGDNRVWNLFMDHYDADVSLTPSGESSKYKQALMDRVIERMASIAAKRSIPIMFLVIPDAIDVVDDYEPRVDTNKYPEYRRSRLTDIVEAIARKQQLPYLNLFLPFQERGAAALYYAGDNNHWNARGQELAARLVAEYILRHHLLEAANPLSELSDQ